MKRNSIPNPFLDQIKAQAEREYPKECCGLILGTAQAYTRLYPCRNLQDEYHEKDPGNFPRNSRNAYFMDPAALLKLQKEMRAGNEEIRIIYHSHIDAPALFSQEDHRMAVYEA